MSALADWSAKLLADGVLYYPPPGVRGGGRVHERRRPLRPVVDDVGEYLAGRLGKAVRDWEIGTPERLVTQEGAHAAIVPVAARSTVDGTPIQIDFGYVLGDDFYDLAMFWTSEPKQGFAMRRLAREVVYQYTLGVGLKRTQRYLYNPPVGYQGLARGLAAAWYAADYPRDHAVIAVAPARPTVSNAGELLGELAQLAQANGFVAADGETRSEPIGSEYGLHGKLGSSLLRDATGVFHRHQVVLVDARYAYALRLDVREGNARAGEHLAAFRRLVTSVEPVPSRVPVELDVFALWDGS